VRTIVKGKNFAVVEEDRRYAERKLHRLERFLDDRTDAIVELSVEQHRSEQDSRIVEVTLMIDGRVVRGVARAATHRAAVDVVLDRLERRGVAARRPVFRPIHRALGLDGYPEAERLWARCLSLPCYPRLSDAEVDAVAAALAEALGA